MWCWHPGWGVDAMVVVLRNRTPREWTTWFVNNNTHTISKKLNIVQFYSRSYINQIDKTTTHQLVIFLCQSVATKHQSSTFKPIKLLDGSSQLVTWQLDMDDVTKNHWENINISRNSTMRTMDTNTEIQSYNIIHTPYIHDLFVAENPPFTYFLKT